MQHRRAITAFESIALLGERLDRVKGACPCERQSGGVEPNGSVNVIQGSGRWKSGKPGYDSGAHVVHGGGDLEVVARDQGGQDFAVCGE
jgi:hypothetical protein